MRVLKVLIISNIKIQMSDGIEGTEGIIPKVAETPMKQWEAASQAA